MRTAAAARLSPLPTMEDFGAVSVPRPPESGLTLDAASAAGMAPLRRQIAGLQKLLSETRAELASEQEGRADDADEMARLLDRIASDDAVSQSLRDDLERERAFVEELRVSVQEKYADCNTLRQRLADAESLVAKELDEAADRHAITERAERAEQDLAEVRKQLDEVRKQLDVSRMSEESTRTEIATLSTQLEVLRRAFTTQEAELGKVNQALKSANMKAFAANRQLESWKSESLRMIEQTRAEQGVVIAGLTAEHAKALESLRREAGEGNAAAAAMRKRVDAATEGLAAAAKLVEATQAALALRSLTPAPQPAAAPAATPTPAPAASPPPAPTEARSLSIPTRPAMPAALAAKRPLVMETPVLEVSELDVRAEDLIEELMMKVRDD
jgi:DNA repair exonuclease SbcCD ATPase subunit